MENTYWKKLRVGVIAAGFLISAVCYTKTEDGRAVLLKNDSQEASKDGEKAAAEKKAEAEEAEAGERAQPVLDVQDGAEASPAVQAGAMPREELEALIREIVQQELTILQEQGAAKPEDAGEASAAEKGQMSSEPSAPPQAGGAGQEGGKTKPQPPEETAPQDRRININTASREELMQLNGIGAARADAIISYRATYGGFHDIEEIMNIPGIKEASFEKIKDQICVR